MKLTEAEGTRAGPNATGAALAYRYDALGRMDRRQLNSETAADYLYDGQSLIAEHADGASPQTKRYVHGAGVDSPLVEYTRQGDGTYVRSWYAVDYKGSIVATTDDAGTTLAIYSYGDFGEPNTFTGAAFRYTGQRLDPDSGLYYYKARWYSPNLGRFLSTDPIGTSDQINLYAYVGNDPTNLSDPGGERPLTAGELRMVSGVFNATVDYSKIDIQSGVSYDPMVFVPNSFGYAVTIRNTINFTSEIDDYSKASIEQQHLLMHEIGHIYQFQNNPSYSPEKAAAEGLLPDTYDYTLDTSRSLTDYRYEQASPDCGRLLCRSNFRYGCLGI